LITFSTLSGLYKSPMTFLTTSPAGSGIDTFEEYSGDKE
jgi:hypothetical protein